MNAQQARKRTQKAVLKNLMKGIYDKIGRASDCERYSITATLPVEGEQVIKELELKEYRVLRVSNTQIRISWAFPVD